MKHGLFIIAPEGFRDEELFEPKHVLEEAGYMCDIVSTIDGACTGKLGATATTTVSLHTLDVQEYDVIILVGGPGAPALIDDFLIVDVLKEAHRTNKVIAAICIAPTILARLGYLKEKKATVASNGVEILQENNVQLVTEPVVVDGSDANHVFITANGPDAAIDFGKKIVEVMQAQE